MPYINDPREMSVNPETGFNLEQDNRREEMYQWGAMIIDLCDLPVEEYMKPMTVIGLGGGGNVEETKYTLKFVIDGTTKFQEKLESGEPIPFNVNGEIEGRTFLGWYNGSTLYKEGDLMPSKSLTLTAKYECDVTFNFIIDNVIEEVLKYSVAYNTVVKEIPETEKEGYDFLGWVPSISEPITAHTNFSGTFESIVYKVTWEGYTDGPLVQEYKYGESLIQPIDPEKEGYTFDKWDKELPNIVTSDLVFNAIFEVNEYEIKYFIDFDNEMSEIETVVVKYGTVINLINIPTENGFSFTNWTGYAQDTNELFNGDVMPAYNLKYVSNKTRNTYVLSYYDNGELVKSENYLFEAEIIPFVYEKEGWNVSDWENLPNIMPYYNVSAHCTSTIQKFLVTFVDNLGEIVGVKEDVEYGTYVKDIEIPEIEGYTYIINEDILETRIISDIVIVGTLNVNNYNVTISFNGVTSIVSLPFGTNIAEYINENYMAEEGYTMSFIVVPEIETVPANNNTNIFVKHEVNVWTLSYSTSGAGDKDINGSINVAFGDVIFNKLPMPSVTGYDFDGWYIDGVEVSDGMTMPNNNVAATGTFTIQMFLVKVVDGENVVIANEYSYGTPVEDILNENIVSEYISNLEESGYNVEVNTTGIVDRELVIELVKTEKEYVLAFYNGENLISSALTKLNSIIIYPTMENYTENGVEYVFSWEDNSYNGIPMPNHDVEIKGSYQEKVEAPIYYGSYVTPISAYSADNVSKYYNETDLNTVYYDSISISECVNGAEIIIFMPAYEPLTGLTDRNAGKEAEKYYEPPVFIIPASVIDKYSVSIRDGIGVEQWSNFITDNNILNINGTDYYFYSRIPNDTLIPGKNDNSDMKVTIKLTEK